MKRKLTPSELTAFIVEEAKKAESQKAYAQKLGISPQYLADILKGRREPGVTVLKALGFQKVISYERAN